jgi:hypothetical protein
MATKTTKRKPLTTKIRVDKGFGDVTGDRNKIRIAGTCIDDVALNARDVTMTISFQETGPVLVTYDTDGNILRSGKFTWSEITSRLDVK